MFEIKLERFANREREFFTVVSVQLFGTFSPLSESATKFRKVAQLFEKWRENLTKGGSTFSLLCFSQTFHTLARPLYLKNGTKRTKSVLLNKCLLLMPSKYFFLSLNIILSYAMVEFVCSVYCCKILNPCEVV